MELSANCLIFNRIESKKSITICLHWLVPTSNFSCQPNNRFFLFLLLLLLLFRLIFYFAIVFSVRHGLQVNIVVSLSMFHRTVESSVVFHFLYRFLFWFFWFRIQFSFFFSFLFNRLNSFLLHVPIALWLCRHLLLGMARIYERKRYLPFQWLQWGFA